MAGEDQGKNEFPTYPELLTKAHSMGLVGIETKELPAEEIKLTKEKNGKEVTKSFQMYKFRATVKLARKGQTMEFTAHGDAHVGNVGEHIVPHLLRMAETRAVSRALRMAVGEGMTSAEELDNLPNSVRVNEETIR